MGASRAHQRSLSKVTPSSAGPPREAGNAAGTQGAGWLRAAFSRVKAVHAGNRAGGPEKAVGLSPKAQDSPAAGYSNHFWAALRCGLLPVWSLSHRKVHSFRGMSLYADQIFLINSFLTVGVSRECFTHRRERGQGSPRFEVRTSLSASGSWD